MTVVSPTQRNDYVGSGITGPYAFTFRVFAATDLSVMVADTEGTLTPLSYPDDFSVSGAGSRDGGSITLTDALATDHRLSIQRQLPIEQARSIRNQGAFFSASVEDALDTLTMIDLQQQASIDRSFKAPATLPLVDIEDEIRSFTPGYYLRVRDDGLGLEGAADVVALSAFLQSGTGAVSRTANGKMGERLSVTDFGAVGDGRDCTTAIDRALARALVSGQEVFFPAGTYGYSGAMLLFAGCTLVGEGMFRSTIRQLGTTSTLQGLLYADSGLSTAQLDGIQIRDLTLDGANTSFTPNFSEYQPVLALAGVKNLYAERVRFKGPRGDGVVLLEVSVAAATLGTPRHNSNVTLIDCHWDGNNNENRNGISVSDCDGLYVIRPYAKNMTKSTMPGFLDIEPNPGNGATVVLRNIHCINPLLEDCGGGVALFNVALANEVFATPVSDIYVLGVSVKNTTNPFVFGFSRQANAGETIAKHNVVFEAASISGADRGFFLFGVATATVRGRFGRCPGISLVGFDGAFDCVDVHLDLEMFENGYTTGTGLAVYGVKRLSFGANSRFIDCGDGTATSAAINFAGRSSSYVDLMNVQVLSPNGRTTYAVKKEAAHTFTPATNRSFANQLSGLLNEFQATQSLAITTPFDVATTSGTFAVAYTMAATGVYYVTILLGGSGATYHGTATVIWDGSTGSVRNKDVGAACDIDVSGANIRVKQSSGFSGGVAVTVLHT